jgi:hypothetical protein
MEPPLSTGASDALGKLRTRHARDQIKLLPLIGKVSTVSHRQSRKLRDMHVEREPYPASELGRCIS